MKNVFIRKFFIPDMPRVCLLSITASHYRKLIYQLLDKNFDCHFIFGKDVTTVKRLDTSIFRDSIDVENKYIAGTNFYYQPGVIRKTRECDVIISDLGIFCLSSWILLLIAKLRRQKVYLWDHGWYGKEGFIKKWLKRLYFSLASGAFIYGNRAYQLMGKNGFDLDKLYVIHNSLDYDKQLDLRIGMQKSDIYKNHFNNNAPVICFIGRLTKVKRIDLIIDALSIIKNKERQINLVIVGTGEIQDEIVHHAKALGVYEWVWFYGESYDEEANAELLYNADICVSPGNVGLTAMHSMMYGCPVITHNEYAFQMPEFEAIKEGETGSFFKYGDSDSLADCVLDWMEKNAERRQAVREACFAEIDSEWNPHRQIKLIKQVVGNM